MQEQPVQYVNWPDWIQALFDAWPSPIIARKELGRFSGGALHPRTEANRNAKGEGIPKLSLGDRVVAYRKVDVCDALASRAKVGGKSHLAGKRSRKNEGL